MYILYNVTLRRVRVTTIAEEEQYSDSVSVAFNIQHAMDMCRIIRNLISGLSESIVFSTLYKKTV
jgi:hypothetical protein